MGNAHSSSPSGGKENLNPRALRNLEGARAGAGHGESSSSGGGRDRFSTSGECSRLVDGGVDLIDRLNDDCLGLIFGLLDQADRNSCSLVCKRWHAAEARSRQLLLLRAEAGLFYDLPELLVRFEFITKLALKCGRKEISIDDAGLFLVGKYVRQLGRLKLKGCRQVTDVGLEEFSKVCKRLKKLSCGSCGFGARGLDALVSNSKFLEDLSVKRLRNLVHEPDGSVGAGGQLKRLCLKDLSNAHVFAGLIAGSRNLRTLVLSRLSGDWDELLNSCLEHLSELVELRMDKLFVKDKGLQAIGRCTNLQVLYVVKSPECTNLGLSAVAQGCRKMRKLHLDGCFMGKMGDEGLKAIAQRCTELQELVLIRFNVRSESLHLLSNCSSLERLAVCHSETFGDPELSCVVHRCQALRKLCIKSCPISDTGLTVLARACPKLVKLKIKKCRRISPFAASQLQRHREALVLEADLPLPVPPLLNAEESSAAGDQRENPEGRPSVLQTPARVSPAKTRLSFLAGPSNLVACTLRRISS